MPEAPDYSMCGVLVLVDDGEASDPPAGIVEAFDHRAVVGAVADDEQIELVLRGEALVEV